MRLSRDYDEKAVHVRKKAASTSDPELRQQLAVIADDYDHMAEVTERIGIARRRVGVARLRGL
jgi:hypothetical protein